jgi:hypothetical protein
MVQVMKNPINITITGGVDFEVNSQNVMQYEQQIIADAKNLLNTVPIADGVSWNSIEASCLLQRLITLIEQQQHLVISSEAALEAKKKQLREAEEELTANQQELAAANEELKDIMQTNSMLHQQLASALTTDYNAMQD